jgi:hypothetical protein
MEKQKNQKTKNKNASKKEEPFVSVTETEDSSEYLFSFNDAAIAAVREIVRKKTKNPKARVTEKILRNFALEAIQEYVQSQEEENKGEKSGN